MATDPEPMLAEALRHLVSRPDRIVLSDDTGQSIDGQRILQDMGWVNAFLASRPAAPGAIAVLQCPNWYEFVPLYLAFARRGLTTALVPMTYEAAELAKVVQLTKPCVVACPVTYRDRAVLEHYSQIDWSGRNECGFIVLRPDVGVNRPQAVAYGADLDGVPASPSSLTWPDAVEAEGQVIAFTAGTTGELKGVRQPVTTLDAINRSMIERYSLTGEDKVFVCSPATHAVGFSHGLRLALILGAHITLQDRWNAATGVELIERDACTFVAAATPFLHDVVERSEADPAVQRAVGSLKWFLCGGTGVPRILRERALAALPGTFVSPLWGMTECGPVTTCPPGSGERCRLDTDGIAMPAMAIRVVDSHGQEVGVGGDGELQVRGPQLFEGYEGRAELTEAAMTADGWLRSGDRAQLMESGAIKIVGRFKELIIRGGLNVSPFEIEAELARHPKISEAVVLGVPDERLGERIGAALVCADGAQVGVPEIQEWLNQRGMARFKWPEVVAQRNSFPRTPAGKVQKQALAKEIGWTE